MRSPVYSAILRPRGKNAAAKQPRPLIGDGRMARPGASGIKAGGRKQEQEAVATNLPPAPAACLLFDLEAARDGVCLVAYAHELVARAGEVQDIDAAIVGL